jgi:hypothetical protein
MKMHPVKSSNIAEIGYEDVSGVLHVRFVGSDGIHRYHNVPSALFNKLLAADSVGSMFHREVRGKFTHTPPAKDKPNAE